MCTVAEATWLGRSEQASSLKYTQWVEFRASWWCIWNDATRNIRLDEKVKTEQPLVPFISPLLPCLLRFTISYNYSQSQQVRVTERKKRAIYSCRPALNEVQREAVQHAVYVDTETWANISRCIFFIQSIIPESFSGVQYSWRRTWP